MEPPEWTGKTLLVTAGLSGAVGLGAGIAWAVYATRDFRVPCEMSQGEWYCPDSPHEDARLLAGSFSLLGALAATGLVIPGGLLHGKHTAYTSRLALDSGPRRMLPIAVGAGLLGAGAALLITAAVPIWEAGYGLGVGAGALLVAGTGTLTYGVSRARWQRRYGKQAQLGAAPIYDRRSGLMGLGVSGRF